MQINEELHYFKGYLFQIVTYPDLEACVALME